MKNPDYRLQATDYWTFAVTCESAKTRLICPLTAPTVEAMQVDMLRASAAGADAVECRLDFLDTPPTGEELRRLLRDAPVEVIATCRPKRQGGKFIGCEDERLAILRQASAAGADWIDVELDVPREDWPGSQVILSHHDFEGCPENLDAIARRMEASAAAVNKIAFAADGPEDALRALEVVRSCGKPTLVLAMGEPGVMSRILAGKFGAFGTFAALEGGAESAPGQLTLKEMKDLYRWDALGPDTSVCGVIGSPIAHSMSPAIHNAAFAAVGVNAVYVPLLIAPGAENFSRFMDELLARRWTDFLGLSVTIPHKENALAYVGADNCDELARKIGAINTITIDKNGALRGDNTDYAAAIDSLCEAMGIRRSGLRGRAVAVLGAGGVARAIVAALVHYGAEVSLFNRTVSRAEKLAEEFSCRDVAALDAAGDADAEIIINCTSLGMHPRIDAGPLERIPPTANVVFDTIYNPIETKLLRLARKAGCRTVSGLDMFVNQAASQFETWMHAPAPRNVMRNIVVERLGY